MRGKIKARGTFFYDLVITTVMRMAKTMAIELEPHNVAAIALTPGYLGSEAMLGFTDIDGTQPYWQRSYEAEIAKEKRQKDQ